MEVRYAENNQNLCAREHGAIIPLHPGVSDIGACGMAKTHSAVYGGRSSHLPRFSSA